MKRITSYFGTNVSEFPEKLSEFIDQIIRNRASEKSLMEKEHIMMRLLRKLINSNMWLHKHTEEINLLKFIPKHLRGEKVTRDAVKELVKQDFILYKISTGERHVSLNLMKQREIYNFLKNRK